MAISAKHRPIRTTETAMSTAGAGNTAAARTIERALAAKASHLNSSAAV